MESDRIVTRGGAWIMRQDWSLVHLRDWVSFGNAHMCLGLRLVRRRSPLERLTDVR